jgi:5-methylcytosine-specific restriction endonuclease McrA
MGGRRRRLLAKAVRVTRGEYNRRSGRSSSQLCRPEKRQRIYARDGFRCQWCFRHASEPGVKLSLDHFLARDAGGGNETDNLFTSCVKCNSSRRNAPALVHAFRNATLFTQGGETLDRILDALERPLPQVVP